MASLASGRKLDRRMKTEWLRRSSSSLPIITKKEMPISAKMYRGKKMAEQPVAAAAEAKKAKGRYTVALSEKSEQLLDELKSFSDAETVTEVIRDALRLSYVIMVAQKEGMRIELCDPKNPENRSILSGFKQLNPA